MKAAIAETISSRSLVRAGLGALCLLSISSAAKADQGAISENMRAIADRQVYAILANVRASSRFQLTEVEARQIADVMLADGKLDAHEIDLIDELSSSSVRAIQISPGGGGDDPVVLGTQSGPAKRVFDSLMTDYLDKFYDAGGPAKGWESLVRYSLTSETAYKRSQNFLAPKALAAGKQSNIANAYKPIREHISGLFARNNQLPKDEPKLNDRGRWLIHVSVKMADMDMSDQLPDYLYSWIRPGGKF
ncbi:hypothetical protein [Parasphingorhabdus sp.]|uniref:hypothetical protein n=1 Tax=Parasphingorhabdus sp. TaxID=2709688 RepID=UPI003593C84F